MQEKTAVKEEDLKQEEKYKWAIVDGVKKEVISSVSLQYIFQSRSVFFFSRFEYDSSAFNQKNMKCLWKYNFI